MGFRERLGEIVVVNGSFTLRTGDKSTQKIELPFVHSKPSLLGELVYKTKKIIDPKTEAIAGCLTGGALMGSILAYEMRIPFFAIDPDERTIEGLILKVHHITVFDDVFRTGSTLRDATDILGERGYVGEIYYAVAVNRFDGKPTCRNRRVAYAIDATELPQFSPSV